MKKRFYNILTIFVLAIFSVFSTGIFISIHHCCSHCNPVEVVDDCCCQSLPSHGAHDHACHQNESGHHKCHDTHYLFKILDSYDKDEHLPVVMPTSASILLYLMDDYREEYETQIFQKIVKENDRSRSGPVIPCDSFFDYTHQLVLYA